MEKRIELEKRGRKPDQIYELNLDNSRSTSIEGLTDDFTNLKSLSLINVGLTSLKGFPKLPNLQKLELSDNRISNGLNLLLTSPMLTSLNLSGNKIKDLETLEPLKQLTHLQSLVLFNNDVTTIENYREQLFKMLTTLKYLDGFDAKEQEADDSEHEFPTCSLNGNDEDSDSEEEDDEDLEEEEEVDDEENELGLEAVYHDNLEEESEGDDYDGEGEKEEDDEEIEEEESFQAENDAEEDTTARGKKRKHDGEEEVV